MHQQPWLVAFPERSVQNLDVLFVDMVHLFRQFGIDLFVRLAQQIERKS